VDKLLMKLLALNVDFNGPSFDFLGCVWGHQRTVPP